MSYREAILEGTASAQRLHSQLKSAEAVAKQGGRVDVFGSVIELDAALQFAALDGLLGAYMKTEGKAGVLVTSRRKLSIQRFTGAHELGHFVMGHTPNVIDGEEILRGGQKLDVETQANAFAAEFLSPRWLLEMIAKKKKWGYDNVRDPLIVYQFSLRIGVSYEAMCHSLKTHKIVNGAEAAKLAEVEPKAIKQTLIQKYAPAFRLENWYPDVWLLTENDQDALIEGNPDDIFILKLTEKTGAGYLWDLDKLKLEGFDIVSDRRVPLGKGEVAVGSSVCRQTAAKRGEKGSGDLYVDHKRPWMKELGFEHLSLKYELMGKESGMPRALRKKLALAVA